MTKFYDAHCHMMNLSHPNLSVMLKRIFKEIGILERIGISFGAFIFVILGKTLPKLIKVDDRLMNLMAIMETELGDCILQMEEDLRNSLRWGAGPVVSGIDGERRYDKIVLTPLIMDFGLKNYEEAKTLYKVRWKPIASQILDICLGIKNYYKYRDKNPLSGDRPTTPLFEIYPFMGINTKNYNMESKSDGTLGLVRLLSNNFTGFKNDTIDTRRANLIARDWRGFKGDIETIKAYDFIGIKVYPPLGFNPWPTETWQKDIKKEMEKVIHFYEFCQNNKIPITAHCSDGGFLVDNRYAGFAHPGKWAQVLEEYPNLRLNLAHFGADNEEWRKAIAQLILTYDNVYTDISYRGVDTGYYDKLQKFLNSYAAAERDKLMERIIFGSDFMINLMAIESYSKYMKNFAQTSAFSAMEKDMFCNRNPESFLFIG